MVQEYFTSFTEVDSANDRIQKTFLHVDFRATKNESTYLYRDYGTDYFTDFTHNLEVSADNEVGTYIQGVFWEVANVVEDYRASLDDNSHTIYCAFFGGTSRTTKRIDLKEQYNGSEYGSTSGGYSITYGTTYYLTIEKDGLEVRCKIYSNSSRTDLLSTLSLTLHTNDSFRYFPLSLITL